jgi:hypothetical protein
MLSSLETSDRQEDVMSNPVNPGVPFTWPAGQDASGRVRYVSWHESV